MRIIDLVFGIVVLILGLLLLAVEYLFVSYVGLTSGNVSHVILFLFVGIASVVIGIVAIIIGLRK